MPNQYAMVYLCWLPVPVVGYNDGTGSQYRYWVPVPVLWVSVPVLGSRTGTAAYIIGPITRVVFVGGGPLGLGGGGLGGLGGGALGGLGGGGGLGLGVGLGLAVGLQVVLVREQRFPRSLVLFDALLHGHAVVHAKFFKDPMITAMWVYLELDLAGVGIQERPLQTQEGCEYSKFVSE